MEVDKRKQRQQEMETREESRLARVEAAERKAVADAEKEIQRRVSSGRSPS